MTIAVPSLMLIVSESVRVVSLGPAPSLATKDWFPNVIALLPSNVRLVRPEPRNAASPMDVTPLGITTEVSDLQFSQVYAGMLAKSEEMVKFFMPDPLNALVPNLLSNVAVSKLGIF